MNRRATVHQLFDAQVVRAPNSVAVEFEDRRLTYADLDHRSNQVAHYLRTAGIGANALVALCVKRSPDMLVGILGILKAGGAYVPLDPTYPAERLAFMLKDSGAQVLLTEAELVRVLPAHESRIVCLDTDWSAIARGPDARADIAISGADLAYVIYTSGSTGRPKGVEIRHASVVNLLCSLREEPGFATGDRLLAVTTLSFDIAVLELLLPLIVGAPVILVNRAITRDGVRLARALVATGATIMQATPATWLLLLEAGWTGGAHFRILSGGDTLTRELVERLLPCCGELWNLYGPTETTVYSTLQRVRTARRMAPIGAPIANTDIHVLDNRGRPAGVDTKGEIHIGGRGLARGYRNRPQLTAEKFIPHPFDASPGARLYRTGDLGRYRADGSLEHLGRIDHQVKLRGFRIELGEIEAVLGRHASVRQVVVTVREDQPGDKRLVAYVSTGPGPRPTIRALREKLRSTLPDYMIPAAFVFVDSFPLTPNQKIDRSALPTPDLQRSGDEFVAPRTPGERRLSAIYAQVLHLDRVSTADPFFDLGGDSLKAAQVGARVREAFQIELPLPVLFDHPTVSGLIRVIERTQTGERGALQPPIPAVARTGPLPLSFSQERVWFIHQLNSQNLAYNFQATIRFRGPLDAPALERSLAEIVRRHEIYRTTFAIVDDQPAQRVHPAGELRLPVVDLSQHAEDRRESAAREWCDLEFQQQFDLACLPLVRWTLLRYARNDHVLVHMEHHVVHDGWSFNVFLRELVEIYSAFAASRPSPLPDLPVQFADFAAWQRGSMKGEVVDGQLAYWKQKLQGMPALLEIPADRARPNAQSFRGTAPRTEIPLALCASLRALSRGRRSTLFMTTLAGFVALIHRYSGRSDVAVGTFFANRRRLESENLIGMILNNVVIRSSLASDPTVGELIDQVRDLVLEAANCQDVPFDRVVDAVRPRRERGYNPLFQVAFGFHDEPMPERGPPGIQVEVTPVLSNGSAKFDLGVIVVPHSAQRLGLHRGGDADGLTMIWEYSTDLFDQATILRMIGHYEGLLTAMVADPQRRISEIPLEHLPRPRSDGDAKLAESPLSSSAQVASDTYVPPANELERRIAAVWRDALNVVRVGRYDDFFDLGGHSLLATRIVLRLGAAIGVEVPLRVLFDAPTVAGLASNIVERLDGKAGEGEVR